VVRELALDGRGAIERGETGGADELGLVVLELAVVDAKEGVFVEGEFLFEFTEPRLLARNRVWW
jgi:hypothetical protein